MSTSEATTYLFQSLIDIPLRRLCLIWHSFLSVHHDISMLLLSYDISKTSTRTKFSKFIEHYGERVQYSVWRIENSPRLLRVIQREIENTFKKRFAKTDSIYIHPICEACTAKTTRYGYAKHEESDCIVLT